MAFHKGGMVFKYIEASNPENDDVECVPLNSRICVLYLQAPAEGVVYTKFARYGKIEYIKILTAKPVVFVKFARASCAERAVEDGCSTEEGIKAVFMAEIRSQQGKAKLQQNAADPEDQPPRSRLFAVLHDNEMAESQVASLFDKFNGFIAARIVQRKAIAFIKFGTASQAAECMEYFESNPDPSIRKVTLAEARLHPNRTSDGPRADGDRDRAFRPETRMTRDIRDVRDVREMRDIRDVRDMRETTHAVRDERPLRPYRAAREEPAPHYEAASQPRFPSRSFASRPPDASRYPARDVAPATDGRYRAPQDATLVTTVPINDDIPRVPPHGIDPDEPEHSRVFFIIPPQCPISEDSLVSLFRRYKGLQYFQRVRGKSYGYAKYELPESAESAIVELNGKEVAGCPLKVVLATKFTERERLGNKRSHDEI